MKKIIFFLFQASFVACCSLSTHNPVTAQPVNTDSTLSKPTEVTPTNAGVEINGGNAQGGNLFHSFSNFSVPTGTEAHFNNNADVANILSRVTGGNISNIDGLIRANGSANLFLINPAGIIFGSNASLDIGGSFLATTADSLLFDEGGEFSAADAQSEPILSINAPIGLNLRDNPQAIENNSTVNNAGLKVNQGKNITLVGGELNFDEGRLAAPGGLIQLGGLSTAGEIQISDNGSLIFPSNAANADITLSNGALVNVRSIGKGNLIVNAGNLDVSENSELRAGISANSTSNNALAGDIAINLTDRLTLDNSNITNAVEPEAVGNAGDINVIAGSIAGTNRGQIDTSTSGQGNGGNINIKAIGDITFDGEANNLESGATSLVNPGAVGNAGSLDISTQGNLSLTNGGRVDVSSNSQGNGGNITVDTGRDLTIDGEDSEQLGSGILSTVNLEAVGSAGDIAITTGGNLTLTNRGRVEANNFGSGQGNGGNVIIDVGGDLIIDGTRNSKEFGSNIRSLVNQGVTGDSGNIAISTGGKLKIENQGEVSVVNNGVGNSGNIAISTGDSLTVMNEGEVDATNNNGVGNSGNIAISTGDSLTLSSGGKIDTNINTQGDAGSIDIHALGDITFEGEDFEGNGSGATSLVGVDGSGNAGNITISTDGNLSLVDGGRIDVSSNQGQGNAGAININALGDITFEGEDTRNFGSGATSQANPGLETGNSGGITIFTGGNLTLKNGGRVDTSTNAPGDAGSINIDAVGDITFEGENLKGDGSGVTSQVNPEARGNAGLVNISTEGNLTLKDGGRIDASINAQGDEVNQGQINSQTQSDSIGSANINLEVAKDITLSNDSLISAKASGNYNGGNLSIDARFIIAFPGNSDSNIIANAFQGTGGEIKIDAQGIFGITERKLNPNTNDINASSNSDVDGNVTISVANNRTFEEIAETPAKTFEYDGVFTQVCDPAKTAEKILAGNENTLIIKKQNLTSSQSIDLLTSNEILNGTQPVMGDRQAIEKKRASSKLGSPILTAQGKIYPARGIVKQADGTIALSTQDTNLNQRLPNHSPNC